MNEPPEDVKRLLIQHALLIAGASELRDFRFDKRILQIWNDTTGQSLDDMKARIAREAMEQVYGLGGLEHMVEEAELMLEDLLPGLAQSDALT